MKISEVVDKTALEALNGWEDEDLAGVYISDMVSDIITGANGCGLLLTLQTHKSLIAAANLVDVGRRGLRPRQTARGRRGRARRQGRHRPVHDAGRHLVVRRQALRARHEVMNSPTSPPPSTARR